MGPKNTQVNPAAADAMPQKTLPGYGGKKKLVLNDHLAHQFGVYNGNHPKMINHTMY
jgi:hypothetical protein